MTVTSITSGNVSRGAIARGNMWIVDSGGTEILATGAVTAGARS